MEKKFRIDPVLPEKQKFMNEEQILDYLRRLHISQIEEPTLSFLCRLHYHHLRYIPYENIDAVNHKHISLEKDDLFYKIIQKERGGYCFELNGLFCWLLESLGYKVSSYAGRFIGEERLIQMRRHRILAVELPEGKYTADVGVNSENFREPLLLKENVVQTDGWNEYRYVKDKFWGWILWQKFSEKDWKPVYGFTEEPQMELDFEMPSFFCVYHQDSPMNKELKLSIFREDCNITIRGNLLKIFKDGKVFQVEELESEKKLSETMKKLFGIMLKQE